MISSTYTQKSVSEGMRKQKWLAHWGTTFCSSVFCCISVLKSSHSTGQESQVLFCPFHLMLVSLCFLSLSILAFWHWLQIRALWHAHSMSRGAQEAHLEPAHLCWDISLGLNLFSVKILGISLIHLPQFESLSSKTFSFIFYCFCSVLWGCYFLIFLP